MQEGRRRAGREGRGSGGGFGQLQVRRSGDPAPIPGQLLLDCLIFSVFMFFCVVSPQWQRWPGDALQGGQGGGQDGALRLHGTVPVTLSLEGSKIDGKRQKTVPHTWNNLFKNQSGYCSTETCSSFLCPGGTEFICGALIWKQLLRVF